MKLQGLNYLVQSLLQEPMEFISLTILKRLDCCGDWYNNVCLVIDGDFANENCTNSDFGFNDQAGDTITWKYTSTGIYFQIECFLTVALIPGT